MNKRHKYGALIKQARKNSGLTQVALSKKIGVSQSALSKFEAGQHIPTIEVFVLISKATHAGLKLFADASGLE